jgi:pimeloyl-ACP methyl ester carboxylesterase
MSFVEDRSILTLESRAPDREIRYGDDPLHIADVWESRPAAGGPLVVLIHGGFWRPAFDRLHLRPFANAIAEAGFTVASVEYRRVPGSPDLTTGDVALACSRVPSILGSKHNRAVVVGHSAGGHLALWCATTVSASALSIVALAPAASLAMSESLNLGSGAASAFLGTSAAERRDLDPYELPSASVPVTIIHGSADEIVPVSVSEYFQRKHTATRLEKVADAGHFAVIDPRTAAWTVVIDEIKRLSATGR